MKSRRRNRYGKAAEQLLLPKLQICVCVCPKELNLKLEQFKKRSSLRSRRRALVQNPSNKFLWETLGEVGRPRIWSYNQPTNKEPSALILDSWMGLPVKLWKPSFPECEAKGSRFRKVFGSACVCGMRLCVRKRAKAQNV